MTKSSQNIWTPSGELSGYRQSQLDALLGAFRSLEQFGIDLPPGAAEAQARNALAALIGLEEERDEGSLQLPLEAETTTLNIRIGSGR